VDDGGPIDPAQQRLAERRLMAALRRHHRREPLRADLRVDTLVAELRAAEPRRASGHRGALPLSLSDADLRGVVDGLVASGLMLRRGHRVRLADHAPPLDPIMRDRIDRLLDGLRDSGAAPPPAEGMAARLGIPPGVIAQLRSAGELVAVGPGIDYPRVVWDEINARLDRLAMSGRLSVGRVRDDLRATRRHAEGILRHRRDRRAVR
jgi:hypothetical protein